MKTEQEKSIKEEQKPEGPFMERRGGFGWLKKMNGIMRMD
jgi:hypothetical protein